MEMVARSNDFKLADIVFTIENLALKIAQFPLPLRIDRVQLELLSLLNR
jgi:hypothetical protein